MALEEARYREVLSSLGLKPETIDYISTRKDAAAATRIYWTGIILYMCLYLGLTAGGLVVGYHLLFLDLKAARVAGHDAIFYDSFWWLHCFALFFLSIFLPAYIVYAILERFPKAAELVALKSIDDMVRRSAPRRGAGLVKNAQAGMERAFVDDTFRQRPVHEALRYYNRKSMRWTKRGTFIMLALLALLLVMDASNYKLVAADGFTYVPYGSISQRHQSWKDLDHVETACGSLSRNGMRLQYNLFFKDGSEVDLLETMQLRDPRTPEEKVKAVEQVGAIAEKQGVPFRIAVLTHGVDAGRKLFDAQCLDKLKVLYPGNYARLVAALKLPQLK